MDVANLEHYVRVFQDQAKGCCAPIFWRNAQGKLRGGTVTFVSTGTQIIGITAGHVADEYLKHVENLPQKAVQVGGAILDSSRLIARDRAWDLATFRLSAQFVALAGNSASTSTWPPELPQTGEVTLWGGFAARFRHDRKGKIEAGFPSFIGPLSSSSEQRLGLALGIATSLRTSPEAASPHEDLGGWSGGPVFRIVESGIAHLELAGIIYEYSAESEIALAHPLTRVTKEGEFEG